MNVIEELEKFVVSELAAEHDKESIAPDEDLLMQGIIDSMGVLKLSSFIEEKFGIKVTDIDMVPENFQNLESLTEFVRKKM